MNKLILTFAILFFETLSAGHLSGLPGAYWSSPSMKCMKWQSLYSSLNPENYIREKEVKIENLNVGTGSKSNFNIDGNRYPSDSNYYYHIPIKGNGKSLSCSKVEFWQYKRRVHHSCENSKTYYVCDGYMAVPTGMVHGVFKIAKFLPASLRYGQWLEKSIQNENKTIKTLARTVDRLQTQVDDLLNRINAQEQEGRYNEKP